MKKIGVTLGILFCLFVCLSGLPVFDCAYAYSVPVYNTDFSSDPGWTTDQPANHYWDSFQQSYYVKAENNWPGYTPSRYFYKQISWDFNTFELKWDITVNSAEWSAGIDFGLLDSNLIGAGGVNGEGIYVDFSRVDRGLVLGLYVSGSGGPISDSTAGGAFSEDVWYSVTLAYDQSLNTVSLDIINRDTNTSVWSTSLSVPGGGFSTPLNYLGGSRSAMGDGGIYTGVDQWAVAEGNIDNVELTTVSQLIDVEIDIKPGSLPNSINLGSNGVTPVAIFSSEDFDATTIDPETVTLAGASIKITGGKGKYLCHQEDVNQDGLIDLVCHVKTEEFSMAPGETIAILEGETFDGISIRGEDYVNIVRFPAPFTGDIAYIKSNSLWTQHFPEGEPTQVPLPLLLVINFPEWSPDGEWLAFHGDVAVIHNAQIHVVRPDGSGYRQVTDGSGNLVNPSFSPDGSKIVFNQVYGTIYTINIDGSNQTPLPVNGAHTRWSPDGNKILYSNWGFTYESDLFVYDLVANTFTQITNHQPGEAFVNGSWSPDSDQIVLEKKESGQSDVWIMKVNDESSLVNLSESWSASNEGWPVWSPDGNYIVFHSNVTGNYDIWYIKTDGTEATNITNTTFIDEYVPDIK